MEGNCVGGQEARTVFICGYGLPRVCQRGSGPGCVGGSLGGEGVPLDDLGSVLLQELSLVWPAVGCRACRVRQQGRDGARALAGEDLDPAHVLESCQVWCGVSERCPRGPNADGVVEDGATAMADRMNGVRGRLVKELARIGSTLVPHYVADRHDGLHGPLEGTSDPSPHRVPRLHDRRWSCGDLWSELSKCGIRGEVLPRGYQVTFDNPSSHESTVSCGPCFTLKRIFSFFQALFSLERFLQLYLQKKQACLFSWFLFFSLYQKKKPDFQNEFYRICVFGDNLHTKKKKEENIRKQKAFFH